MSPVKQASHFPKVEEPCILTILMLNVPTNCPYGKSGWKMNFIQQLLVIGSPGDPHLTTLKVVLKLCLKSAITKCEKAGSWQLGKILEKQILYILSKVHN